METLYTGADGILIDSDDTPSFKVTANISIGNTIEPIQGADIIMSFVNHGKCNVKSDNGWGYLPLVNIITNHINYCDITETMRYRILTF